MTRAPWSVTSAFSFRGLFTSPLIVALISGTLAQTDPTREVQARYAECNALEKTGKPLEFQRKQEGNDLSAWQKSDPNAIDVYEFMRLHLANNRVRSVRLEESSASGDWSSVTTYCFRANGTRAVSGWAAMVHVLHALRCKMDVKGHSLDDYHATLQAAAARGNI